MDKYSRCSDRGFLNARLKPRRSVRPAKHRPNPKTQETVYRVYRISEPLRKAMRQKRTKRGQTVQKFIRTAIGDELPRIIESLGKIHVSPVDPEARPAKLPLDDKLLAELKQASAETGLPQTQLFLACLGSTVSRKRRLPKRKR